MSNQKKHNSRLTRSNTEVKDQLYYRLASQRNLKRPSTLPEQIPLNLEMQCVDEDKLKDNPFLRARTRAYMKHLTTLKPVSSRHTHKDPSPEEQVPLNNDNRITFKRVSQDLQTSNTQTVKFLKKKLQISRATQKTQE